MIFVTKKALARRTFLKGVGASLALPMLDAMVPAFASTHPGPAPTRLSIVYLPNGIMMDQWTPTQTGANFQITPILKPLAPFRDQLLILTGMAHQQARAIAGENTGDHARAGASYLCGVHPKMTEGADTQAATTVDQIAAATIGRQTRFGSLELCLDTPELLGQCEAGYSCAYMNSICWRTPTTPLPMENRPRRVFERLFGDSDSTDPAVRRNRIEQDRSILDSVRESTQQLMGTLGGGDQAKLEEYLEAVREVEQRLATAERSSGHELPTLQRPSGVPETFTEHARLMFDLQVLAFQSDLTRVSTFMVGREFGGRTYREIGIPEGYHALTHHLYDPQKIAKATAIQAYHAQHFAYYLDRLATTADGDGSLLDHMAVLYGGGLSDGNLHLHDNLPTVLAGGGSGAIKGGRHIRYAKDTPLTNLLLTLLDIVGAPEQDTLGDSTGRLDLSLPA